MAVFDPLFRAVGRALERLDDLFERILDPPGDTEQGTDIFARVLEQSQPADEIAGLVVDLVEEFIASDLQQEGELTPENVEEVMDNVEGGAMSVLGGFLGTASLIEASSAGQIDQQTEAVLQLATAMQFDDVTGSELEARIREGAMPAMEAKVSKEHRSQFVALPDAVETLLRAKDADEGWLHGENVDPRWADVIGSDEPVNPDNLVEEWGIRDDNLAALERVSLEAMEFEELIETPAELGLVVPDDVLNQVLDLAGYPEDLKDFLRQVPEEIPRSNRAWEERTAVEALVDELETVVKDEELSPREARALLPDEVDVAADALEDRFRSLQTVPPGAPTRALVEGSFGFGYTDLDELKSRLERLEYDPDRYDDVLRLTVLEALDGDLQEAVALGLLDPGTFSDYAEFAGLDDEAIDLLLRGQSFADITTQRLREQADPAELSVRTLSGIGDSRTAGLEAAGIETVGDMAAADVETVADAAEVSTSTAQSFIDQAQDRLS